MDYYRTAKLKVHNPSGYKRRRVRQLNRTYSKLYVEVLRKLNDEDTLRKMSDATKTEMRDEIREVLPDEATGILRSGLIEDAIDSLRAYFENSDAEYPAPSDKQARPTEELLDNLTSEMTLAEENELKWALRRKEKKYVRPLKYPRYRDAPILKSPDGEKMWVAIKTTKADKKTRFPDCKSLRPIRGSRDWTKGPSRKWLLLPIEVSQWHMHRFFDKGTPKSSKVIVEDGDIYVHYAFGFDSPDRDHYEAVVGVDRGRAITAAYAAVRPDGSVIDDGSSIRYGLRDQLKEIDNQIAADQSAGRDPGKTWDKRRRLVQHSLHHIANEIVEVADEHNAIIALEDLENISGATGSQFDKGLKRSQYQRVSDMVEERAGERGLWQTEVHPAYTSTTCPECGTQDDDSRVDRETFRCVSCGHEAHADLNAARMIAISQLWRLNGGTETAETLMKYTEDLAGARNQGQNMEIPEFN